LRQKGVIVKKKKLLIALAVVAVVVVVVVVMASVFSVQKIAFVYHNLEGQQVSGTNGPTADEILKISKGKSIVFLSKNKLLNDINKQYTDWHAFAIVKNFPNILEIHLVERVAVAKVNVTKGVSVYVDSFGHIIAAPEEGTCLDISSAFLVRNAKSLEIGSKLEFEDASDNVRLEQTLQAIVATWQCKLDYQQIPEILGASNVFTYDADGNLRINMKQGAKIVVKSPQTNLSDRLIQAYSVYYNSSSNLQQSGVVITVAEDGKISSNK